MNKKAFTLLELIIVIVIIGVLASLALPRLFAMVEYARAAEALVMLRTLHEGMLRCSLRVRSNGLDFNEVCLDGQGNLDWESLLLSPPGPSSYFDYALVSGGAIDTWDIAAFRNSVSRSGNPERYRDYLELEYSESEGLSIEGRGLYDHMDINM